jgi:ABC-type amino acid transport substrate-binding protein
LGALRQGRCRDIYIRDAEASGTCALQPPVIVGFNVIMVLKGRAFKFEKMSDLTGLRLAGRIGFRYPPVDKGGITLSRAKTDEKNVKRIVSGQLDGAIISSIIWPYIAKELGVESKVEFLNYSINPIPPEAALNMKRFSAADLKAHNAAVAKIRADGDWARILKENGIEKLVANGRYCPS